MNKRKAVVISITEDEFNYIYFAVNEYLEFIGGSHGNLVETNLDSFQRKYWRAVQTRQRRDAIKKCNTKNLRSLLEI